MKEYIECKAVIQAIENDSLEQVYYTKEDAIWCVRSIPAAEVYDLDDVAQILYDTFGDRCACNYNGNDEWLWEYCELVEECPHPADKLGCWRQYVKHYKRREGYERTLSETQI